MGLTPEWLAQKDRVASDPGLTLTDVMIKGLDLKTDSVVPAKVRPLPPQIGTLNYDNETMFLINCRFNGELVSVMKVKDKVYTNEPPYVRYDLSFLELLAAFSHGGRAVYVAGARRGTQGAGRGWLLSRGGEQAAAFREMVRRTRQRNARIPAATRDGIRRAAAEGKPIGVQRQGAHRFTTDQQRKGGKATAAKRRLAANAPYRQWTPEMLRLREAAAAPRASDVCKGWRP